LARRGVFRRSFFFDMQSAAGIECGGRTGRPALYWRPARIVQARGCIFCGVESVNHGMVNHAVQTFTFHFTFDDRSGGGFARGAPCILQASS
jgi:hypothetical protein